MEFRLLGPLEVIGDDGASIALGGVRPRALLAQLLLIQRRRLDRPPDRRDLGRDTAGERRGRAPGARARSPRSARPRPHRHRAARLPRPRRRRRARSAPVSRSRRLATGMRALALWRGGRSRTSPSTVRAGRGSRLEEARLAALEARIDADLDAGAPWRPRGRARRARCRASTPRAAAGAADARPLPGRPPGRRPRRLPRGSRRAR